MRRNRKNMLLLVPIALCLAVILASCAPEVAVAPVDMVWPMPPERPRIKYVASYYGSGDVEKGSRFLKTLMGDESYVGFQLPQGVATDSKGNIYVADTMRDRLGVFDFGREKLRLIGAGARERVSRPVGLAIAERANILFVASSGTQKVIGYDLSTDQVRVVLGQELGFFRNPVGVAVDEERGRVYVTDSKKSDLKVFDITGKYLSTIANAGTADNQLYGPAGISVDRAGNIYVADTLNFKVKVFGPDGSFKRTIGLGHGDISGYFTRPFGVATDSEGHVYASDAGFGNIQIFDRDGRILMAFGTPGNGPGFFAAPMYIWIDGNDKIYVADSQNSRIQVFQYLKDQQTGSPAEKTGSPEPKK